MSSACRWWRQPSLLEVRAAGQQPPGPVCASQVGPREGPARSATCDALSIRWLSWVRMRTLDEVYVVGRVSSVTVGQGPPQSLCASRHTDLAV